MSDLEKQIEDAERALNNAVKKLGTVTGKSAQGAENEYGQAYQTLTRLGARPKLKKRYRS